MVTSQFLFLVVFIFIIAIEVEDKNWESVTGWLCAAIWYILYVIK